LTALRIAYLNQKDCCINKPVLFIYLFFQCWCFTNLFYIASTHFGSFCPR
jgi:hypothetical protein